MTRPLDLVLFAVYTVASVAGLVILKAWLPAVQASWQSGQFAAAPAAMTALGAAAYIGSFLVWLVILTRSDLSVAYPLAIGLTLGFTTLAAYWAFGEAITLSRGLGVAVIFAGVWLVARS